jgi:NADH-quinone oxidoreductase subunit G
VTWDGRPRSFDAVFTNPSSLPDLRVLAGIADELAAVGHGRPLGFRTVAEVRAEMQALGPWDGARPALDAGKAPKPPKGPRKGEVPLALATWKQLVDLGSMQDGEEHLRATARTPVARVSRGTYESALGMLGAQPAGEQLATITGDRGSVTLPVVVADLPDGVVWVPARSFGRGVLAELASPGSPVTLKGAS